MDTHESQICRTCKGACVVGPNEEIFCPACGGEGHVALKLPETGQRGRSLPVIADEIEEFGKRATPGSARARICQSWADELRALSFPHWDD